MIHLVHIFHHNLANQALYFNVDSPKAYTDYTPNHIRIIPEGYDVNNITHGSEIDPNLIKVEQVYKSILSYT